MLSDHPVIVTGGAGFLGKHVCAVLRARGCRDIVVPRRREYDLRNRDDAERLMVRYATVIHLAASVGGIGANRSHPGSYFYDNISMGVNVIEAARSRCCRKVVLAGTVCSYPKLCPVPFREDELWNGFPEETNAPYGVSKKTLMMMLDGYQKQYGLSGASLLMANLYGPGDDFDDATSHVIPALIKRFCEAAELGLPSVTCWGTGNASREFLFVRDAAEAVVRAAERIDQPYPINVGTGCEITIRELAETIAETCGYRGSIEWDANKPDGQPRRCLDTSRAASLLDWQASTPLADGLRETVAWWRAIGAERSTYEDPES